MNRRESMLLRVLINRYNSKAGSALLKFLPKEEAREVMNEDIPSTDLNPILELPQKAISKIHFSWIQPALAKFPESLQRLFISALTPDQIAGFKLSHPLTLSDFVKSFLLNRLYQELEIKEHYPIEYLPESDLSELTKWNKLNLMDLADFLGLFDLASEVRTIVDRNYLKNIYNCLTPKQLQYLKLCLHQQEKLMAPKLGIDPSKQDCHKLKYVIHRRGLFRMGKALCGQHPDLVWNIAHVLDIGRGAILLKEYQTQELPKVTKILKQQVLNTMSFLNSPYA